MRLQPTEFTAYSTTFEPLPLIIMMRMRECSSAYPSYLDLSGKESKRPFAQCVVLRTQRRRSNNKSELNKVEIKSVNLTFMDFPRIYLGEFEEYFAFASLEFDLVECGCLR